MSDLTTYTDDPNDLELAPWGGGSAEHSQGALVAAQERQRAEIESAMTVAKRFPRGEQAALERLKGACRRPSLAGSARYSFPRGGSRVTGPSVTLYREAVRAWGNIRSGVEILPAEEGWVHLRGWAWDLESNYRAEYEDRFEKKIQRKVGGKAAWIETEDERELRELVFRRGAFLVRNAMRDVMPSDVIEMALGWCTDTEHKASAGKLERDRKGTVRALVEAYESLGVTVAMLDGFLRHSTDEVTPDELTELRAIHTSLKDKQARVSDYFKPRQADAQAIADKLLGGDGETE